MDEFEYFNSEEFLKKFDEIVNKDTWDKDLPKYYMNEEGWLVEHWKDGTINKIKQIKNETRNTKIN